MQRSIAQTRIDRSKKYIQKMKLSIEIQNPAEVQFIKELLQKLNVHILSESVAKEGKDQSKAFRAIEELAKRGTYAQDIKDPVVWQKEIRKDRKLPFRED